MVGVSVLSERYPATGLIYVSCRVEEFNSLKERRAERVRVVVVYIK